MDGRTEEEVMKNIARDPILIGVARFDFAVMNIHIWCDGTSPRDTSLLAFSLHTYFPAPYVYCTLTRVYIKPS